MTEEQERCVTEYLRTLREYQSRGVRVVDSELRELWRVAGGGIYMPTLERPGDVEARMSEQDMLVFLRKLLTVK